MIILCLLSSNDEIPPIRQLCMSATKVVCSVIGHRCYIGGATVRENFCHIGKRGIA